MNALLDTHVWIWWLTASPHIRRLERDALDLQAEGGGLGISAISLWEAQMLYAKERLSLPISLHEWLRRAADSSVVTVVPLDTRVVLAADELPATFHGDPADRLIVATAIAHGLPLATRDTRIRDSRVVDLWRPDGRRRRTRR